MGRLSRTVHSVGGLGGYGSQVSGTWWWEWPRPRSFPEAHTFPSSSASGPGACPTSHQGPCQPGVGAPRLAGQRPVGPSCLSPRGGSVASSSRLWAAAGGPSPHFSICCLLFLFWRPPQQLGADTEEVCLASHATSAVAPLPPPRPHPPKFPSDTQLQSQPLIIPPGPPHALGPGGQSDPASAA